MKRIQTVKVSIPPRGVSYEEVGRIRPEQTWHQKILLRSSVALGMKTNFEVMMIVCYNFVQYKGAFSQTFEYHIFFRSS